MPGVSPTQPAAAAASGDDKDDEIADLKAQLAALNAKIDKLS
jgi:polyhydroxyalkanoate synthesis regulator protein